MGMKLLLFILFINSAYSYPIFYKCSVKGELTETFSEQEEKELAKKLKAADCASLNDCMSQLKQVLTLTAETSQISNRLYQASKTKIENISAANFKALSENHRTLKKLRMCNEEQHVEFEQASIPLYYPHETTYQYITGYRKDNKNDYSYFTKPEASTVKQIIDESVAIGVDPLGVLGMAMMERAGGGLDEYYKNMHDKRSQEVLGCTPGKLDKAGNPQVAKRSKRFNEIASKLKLGNKTEKHFVCVGQVNDGKVIDDTHGFSSHSSLADAKALGNTCCVETTYPMSYNEGGRRIATYMYFDQIQNPKINIPLAKNYQSSIEHRLNTFLGMSTTVGTYPSYRISPHRVGVNSYTDPNYGRQIMDYMLNSFMRSGEVMKFISDAEKTHNKKRVSLLCYNQKPGTYTVDSDMYFSKIKKTGRMKPIKALFDQGKSWDDIGIAFQSVLLQEFTYYKPEINQESPVYKKFKKYMTASEMIEFDRAAKHLYEYRNASVRDRTEKLPPLSKEENALFNKFYKLYFTKPEFYQTRKSLVNAAKEDTEMSWSRSTDENIQKIKNETDFQ
jgi:hypothetical protein